MAKQKDLEALSSGEMLLKGDSKPVDCVRLMLQKTRVCPKAKIGNPEDAVKLMKEMGDYERERAIILHLDTKNNVLAVENISTGSLNVTIVHPREAIKGAVLNSAANVIFLHNHPSGDATPSVEDLATDRRLNEAFSIVGINLLDSIIVARDSYYSAKEHGTLFPDSKYKSGVSEVMERKVIIGEDNQENNEKCSLAMEAALSVLSESCSGDGSPIGIMEPAPQELLDIRDDDIMSQSEKIEKVESSSWAQKLSKGLVKSVKPHLKSGTEEYDEAVNSMAHKVAVGLVTKAV